MVNQYFEHILSPDRVSNPGPLTYESGALPTAQCGPATADTDQTTADTDQTTADTDQTTPKGAICSGLHCLTHLLILTHCILVDSSTVICWMSPVVILGASGLFCHFYSIFWWKILLVVWLPNEDFGCNPKK